MDKYYKFKCMNSHSHKHTNSLYHTCCWANRNKSVYKLSKCTSKWKASAFIFGYAKFVIDYWSMNKHTFWQKQQQQQQQLHHQQQKYQQKNRNSFKYPKSPISGFISECCIVLGVHLFQLSFNYFLIRWMRNTRMQAIPLNFVDTPQWICTII